MNYLEDVKCPNREFHRRKYIILRDLEDSLIYNCGCGCKFEWYGDENTFIIDEGDGGSYEEQFYSPKLYRTVESALTKTFYIGMIGFAVAGTMFIGAMAIRVFIW